MQRHLTIAIAAALAFSFMAVAPASADSGRAPQNVRYAELNIGNEAGAQTLLRRIRYAARQACGDRHGPMELSQRAEVRRCVRDAVEQGVRDVNRSELSALYYGREPAAILASN